MADKFAKSNKSAWRNKSAWWTNLKKLIKAHGGLVIYQAFNVYTQEKFRSERDCIYSIMYSNAYICLSQDPYSTQYIMPSLFTVFMVFKKNAQPGQKSQI